MPPEGDHAQALGNRRQPAARDIKIACARNNRGNCSPSVRRESSCRRRRFPAQRERRKKSHQPSEPGRGGDPREAGAPQQARISPAKREDARRLAPCGERRTGNTTCDSDALHHTDKGEYGGRRECRGACPSHPLPLAGRRPRPDAGLKPSANGRNKKERTQKKMPPEGDHTQALGNRRQPAAIKNACARNNRGNCSPSVRRESSCRRRRFPAQRERRKKSHQPSEPGRGGDPRAAGAPQQARISPAKREDARRLAPAASGGQGIRHAIATPSARRTRGVRGS